eukprot:scaffold126443_cov54-Phaeocystis_antarctica.AAC.4
MASRSCSRGRVGRVRSRRGLAVDTPPQREVRRHRLAQPLPILAAQGLPRLVGEGAELSHGLDHLCVALRPPRLDVVVHLAAVARVREEGEPQQGEVLQGQTHVVAVAALLQQWLREVHVHAPLVGLDDAILQPRLHAYICTHSPACMCMCMCTRASMHTCLYGELLHPTYS